MTTHLSHGTSGALRTFAGWVARGTVGLPLLEGIDYWPVLRENPSEMEVIFAIFANVLELDEDGNPTNARYAEHRAAVELYRFCTGEFPAGEARGEDYEFELY
jgi:hypothetical protein